MIWEKRADLCLAQRRREPAKGKQNELKQNRHIQKNKSDHLP